MNTAARAIGATLLLSLGSCGISPTIDKAFGGHVAASRAAHVQISAAYPDLQADPRGKIPKRRLGYKIKAEAGIAYELGIEVLVSIGDPPTPESGRARAAYRASKTKARWLAGLTSRSVGLTPEARWAIERLQGLDEAIAAKRGAAARLR
tara:strand:+ start:5828 stop:6277 length:450 start_codon:yes stop_codon:yes gene_type:complete